jgi:CRISPR/Cas system-associated protein endoribonuclease Cas2
LDIINPESRNFARVAISPEYLLDYSPIRSVSVSSDTRYISVAGKIGFAHLSTTSGRWRVLDTMEADTKDVSTYEDIPQVRGGMCWYGNVFLVGADYGESHEVVRFSMQKRLMKGTSISSKRYKHGSKVLASSGDIRVIDIVNVAFRGLFACLLCGQCALSLLGCSDNRNSRISVTPETCSIWSN